MTLCNITASPVYARSKSNVLPACCQCVASSQLATHWQCVVSVLPLLLPCVVSAFLQGLRSCQIQSIASLLPVCCIFEGELLVDFSFTFLLQLFCKKNAFVTKIFPKLSGLFWPL